MKRLPLAAVAVAAPVLLPCLCQAAPPTAPAGFHWVKVAALSDEFDENALDLGKWQPKHPYWNGPMPSRFEPTNVAVHDGYLWLRSTINAAQPAHDSKHVWIDAACVTSATPKAFYGYYEVRMKGSSLPTLSSFWLQNKPVNPTGDAEEIDVQEGIGSTAPGKPGNVMSSSLHYFPHGWGHAESSRRDIEMSRPVSDWHVYGVWWKDANTVIFYVDGTEVATEKPAQPFVRPMYLFLDTEQHRGPLPLEMQLNDSRANTMMVDWVRSYTLASGG